jgi:hypothetical protein
MASDPMLRTTVEFEVGVCVSGLRVRHSCMVEVSEPATSIGMVLDEMINFRDVSSV